MLQSLTYPRVTTVHGAVSIMLLASDLPESDDCTGCCACKCFQSLTYPRVTTVRLLCLPMLPVPDLTESDDCAGCCVCKCFSL
ncbi:hypothetical protein DPMN_040172 [Dreissena polymorpha]|uniref:Uncharacterized protein n=1 Tax=Dreissena polymorpha TaxID=45954 RepID=A0A9D4CUJ4_DREPO|nr:hypothetical protein DPMN_040172 [Dreissena polymorpha]